MSEQVTSPQNPLRLAALRELNILDTETEKVYDDITKLTADLCETPICCLLYTSPSPRDRTRSRMPSSA